MEKYGRAREASNDNIIMVHTFYMLNTYSEYVVLLALHGNNGYTHLNVTFIHNLPIYPIIYVFLKIPTDKNYLNSHYTPPCLLFQFPLPKYPF